MERNKVVLVNKNDIALGEMNKLEAHQTGVLHRAFSIFIFNEKGEMLIHQRSHNKYHGAGLWTNACCSHPQWGEDIQQSAQERLKYEMGLTCPIEKIFSFIYKTEVENNLKEHEYDHVFVGYTNEQPTLNSQEVQAYKWISFTDLQVQLATNPALFTTWFKLAFHKVMETIN